VGLQKPDKKHSGKKSGHPESPGTFIDEMYVGGYRWAMLGMQPAHNVRKNQLIFNRKSENQLVLVGSFVYDHH